MKKMSIQLSSRSSTIGFLSLLLLVVTAAGSVLVPLVRSAEAGDSFAEFVLQTSTESILRLSITTNDIIYNPQDKTIYATRPSSVGDDGNSITRINPLTGEIGASVYVGSEPNQLALSDDGKTLYVALNGAFSIRRYDTATQTAGLQFSIGRGQSVNANDAPYYANDLAVAPGNPNLLAVARHIPGTSPPGAGAAIYNNGVRLSNTGISHSGAANYLAFSNSATTLYGGGYDEGLRTMTVNESGITDNTGGGTSFEVKELKFENNLIFTSTGRIINPETRTLIGTFFGVNTPAFVPVTEAGRVLYAVKDSSTSVTIKAFDTNTFLPIGSLTVPNVGNDVTPTTLLRYGTNGLVMRTSNNQLYLIQTSLIPTDNPLPAPSATPTITPTPSPTIFTKFIRSVTLTNKDLIYNRTEKKFYASVPGTAGTPQGNTITRIEPTTGEIESSVTVGNNPGRLALSDDDKTLYVGIDGANAVRKFDIQTQTPSLQFPLGNGVNGPKTAYDIDVLPGNPNAVAVSYGNTCYNYDGADIYDDGVKRAQKANASGQINIASTDTLYVGENYVYKYGISANGLSLQKSFTTGSAGESVLVGNLLYTSGGGVLDLTTNEFKGSFSGVGYWSGLTVDVSNNRIFYLANESTGTPSWSIKAYRLDNFLFVGSIPLPGVSINFPYCESPHRLIRWGENGLAINDSNNKIYFIQTNLVSAEGNIPTPTPTSTTTPTVTPTLTPTPTPTVTPTPTPSAATFVRRINLSVNDFVYNASTQSIYASLPSTAGAERGNTITKVNPLSGTIGSSIFVGSEPNKMTASDDGKTIYIKLDGANSIRRFDVSTGIAGLQFMLKSPFHYVQDMKVQPGNSQVIAIANGYDGVAIYENGVQRPTYGDGGAYCITSIDFADTTTLYGFCSDSVWELVKFTINGSGVTGVNLGMNLIFGYGAHIKYVNGLIYSSSGRVVNPVTKTVVTTFQPAGSQMAIDEATHRIFFINENILTAYDTNTYAKIGSVTLPAFSGPAFGLVRWGVNGLAFRAADTNGAGQLYLIQSSLVSPTNSVPTGIQLSSQNYNGSESSTGFQVVVTRTGDLSATSTIDYNTGDGTATAGADYTATNGTLTFAAGETSKTVSIPILNDNIFEGNESFNFALSNLTGGANVNLLDPKTATLTISDNDNQPSISAQNITINEPGITGTVPALFTVRLSNPTTKTVTVNYSTANGTAFDGSDYLANSGTLTFAPLETTKTVAIEILADNNFTETNENFRINFTNAVNAFISVSQTTATIVNYNPQTARHVRFDFDGDGKSDFSIYRPEAGEWWFQKSSDGGNAAVQFGTATDKIVPADYTGDGKTDFAFYRPEKGEWYILRSEDFSYYAFSFGLAEDVPVPADYDGDGYADPAVYRPSTNFWYILKSTGGITIQQYGINGDVPVPADYNGDRKTDIAVYNSSSGSWKVKYDFGGLELSIFIANTNKPVPADYTGDGKADIALYDTVTNDWLIVRSENQTSYTTKFGIIGDIPVPADYDGDNKADIAIYRPSTTDWWYAVSSANGQQRARQFGINTDLPLPSAYIR